MNLKNLSIIFLVFLTLIFAVAAVSAAEEVVKLEATDSNIDTNVVSSDVKTVKSQANTTSVDNVAPKVNKEKIKTKVEADQKAVKYKKSTYYKIKVEDRYDDDIELENVKLKVKVGKGKNARTFNIKTNSYGIAKFNTKNLKIGSHIVVITSADDKYEVSKKSKIFVGKQYTKTLKSASKKVLKNKDVMSLKFKNDDDEKEVKVVLKKSKFTKILKAKFYLKNRFTGKVIVKTDKAEFDDGKWDLPDEDFSYRYSLQKVKVYYISTK